MAEDRILTSRDGAIARIVFNNPQRRNAVSLAMWEAVERLVDLYAEDQGLRVLILAGAGGRAFVSGADISRFADERATAQAVAHYNATTKRVGDKIAAFPWPTIAQINGFCIGGGVALATCCDLRYCEAGSQFAIPAARLGLGYGFDGVRRLAGIVGPAFTKEIFFTARRFSAQEAQAMGLVNAVVPDGEVEARVQEVAHMIARNAPLTVAQIKATVNEALKDPGDRDLDRLEAMVRACFASEDYIEGRQAFLEKREPTFTGR